MSDDIEINLDDPEDIGIAVDDDSPISVEMPEGGMDGRSIHPAGEWSDAVEYAYLDLVTHEGSSYTAVRAVPAGTELTDTYYWQLTAEKGDPGDPGTPEWGAITGDLSDQTDLADALLAKAPVILNSASGSIASFSDGSPAPVTALSVAIEPVQDLHGYDNPWPAGGGKNLLNMSWLSNQTVNGITFTNNDGQITITGTATATTNLNGPIFVLPAGTYSLSGSISNNQLYLYDNDNNVVIVESANGTSRSATISESKNVYLRVRVGSGASVSGIVKPQLESGSSATSWTPYSNICPISGHDTATVTRTGKNLFIEAVGKYIDSPTPTQYRLYGDGTAGISFIGKIDKNKQYTVSALPYANANRWRIVLFEDYPTSDYTTKAMQIVLEVISGITTTKTTSFNSGNYNYCVLTMANSSVAFDNTAKAQLELGSTATAYEAPQIQTVTIDLDGTRYGGVIDVLTGEMTVDRVYKTFDDLSWTRNTSGTNPIFVAQITDKKNETIICSAYKYVGRKTNQALSEIENYTCAIHLTAGAPFVVRDDDYATADAFKTAMASAQIVYPLATPLTVQLTPAQIMQTLLGENNVWADTGDVAVGYRADTKLFIEKLTKPTEDDMIANTNIAANTFFMVGNSLYYATSAIATGTTIVPWQNCTALSLAEALNNLNA